MEGNRESSNGLFMLVDIFLMINFENKMFRGIANALNLPPGEYICKS
jgi:hypothetical protein